MRRALALAVVASALPGSALASPVTQTFTYGPVAVDGYAVRQQATANIPRPEGAGFITHRAPDAAAPETGKQAPINRIIPPHTLSLNAGEGGHRAGVGDAFYGDGEERARLDLPEGYGYPVGANDRWVMVW